jgi:hypothetical protein
MPAMLITEDSAIARPADMRAEKYLTFQLAVNGVINLRGKVIPVIHPRFTSTRAMSRPIRRADRLPPWSMHLQPTTRRSSESPTISISSANALRRIPRAGQRPKSVRRLLYWRRGTNRPRTITRRFTRATSQTKPYAARARRNIRGKLASLYPLRV